MEVKRNIRIVYGIALLQGMVFYGPVATLYRQNAGVSVFQIAMIEGISLALSIILELPWGILADRIGYRWAMISCCALYFISKIVFWQADGFFMFLLERIMLGIVIAGLSGLDLSLLYASCPPDRAQSVFGVYGNMGNAGLLIAAGVYSLMIGDDYRLAGFLTVVSYGLAAALALGLKEVRPQRTDHALGIQGFRTAFAALVKNRSLLLLLIATGLLSETHQMITVFMNQLQYSRCGMRSAGIGGAFILMTVSGFAGGLYARITRRLGVARTGIVLLLGCALACGTLALTRSALVSVTCIVAVRIGFSIFMPLGQDIQNRQVATADRATALSINAVLLDGIAIAVNLIFGRMAEVSVAAAMGLGAALCLTGLILYGIGWKRTIVKEVPHI